MLHLQNRTEVPRPKHDELTAPPMGEKSETVRKRVEEARQKQTERFTASANAVSTFALDRLVAGDKGEVSAPLGAALNHEPATYCNAQMGSPQIRQFCQPTPDAACLLSAAIDQMHLSARAYDRILKLSRTIADLAGEEQIGVAYVAEAVQYRALDRKLWG